MKESKTEPQVQTAIRVPEAFLGRVDKLAAKMSEPGMRVTRTEVLRVAAFKGVEQLEAERSTKKK